MLEAVISHHNANMALLTECETLLRPEAINMPPLRGEDTMKVNPTTLTFYFTCNKSGLKMT